MDMQMTVKQINDQFSQDKIQPELNNFIYVYSGNRKYIKSTKETWNRTMDFLFYCILEEQNFKKYKDIKNNGRGSSDWSSGAQVIRFLNKSNEYRNGVQPPSSRPWFKGTDTLADVENQLNTIKYTDQAGKQVKLDKDHIDALEEIMNQLKGSNMNISSAVNKPLSVWDSINRIKDNKQIVFTGAPGTGKTYAVKEFVKKAVSGDDSRYRFVQFHSSYDYTDFVEGLRPVPGGNGGNMFVRMDGVFKEFCRHIVNENLKIVKDNNSQHFSSVDEYFDYMNAGEDNREAVYRQLEDIPYYFIIDEINRADLGRVFGELMYGLEESYREIHNRFKTQYKNLQTYEMIAGKAVPIVNDCFKDGFFVPYNLYIIGTMNDIDRSVESFDFALRRRFVWVDIKANEVMKESLKSMRDNNKNSSLSDAKIEEICNEIIDMNEKITKEGIGLNEAYHIGPAYFKEIAKTSDADADGVLAEVFDSRIAPILREYTRGRKSEVVEHLIGECKVALGID